MFEILFIFVRTVPLFGEIMRRCLRIGNGQLRDGS